MSKRNQTSRACRPFAAGVLIGLSVVTPVFAATLDVETCAAVAPAWLADCLAGRPDPEGACDERPSTPANGTRLAYPRSWRSAVAPDRNRLG